jgi:hypothetical protein
MNPGYQRRESKMELKDFARSRAALEEADNAVVARIRPLPADVVPSKHFQEQVRLQLLQLDGKAAMSRQAA